MEARKRNAVLSVLVVVPFLLAGCTAGAECTGQQAAGGQSGVCNVEGSFAYGGQVSGESGTETYEWENPQSQAEVAWGGQGSSGSVTVTILDARGDEVYRSTFSGGQSGASETTRSGQPGAWTIRVTFEGFTGQMGLSVQAR